MSLAAESSGIHMYDRPVHWISQERIRNGSFSCLMSGPSEAGKRLCWELFEETMRGGEGEMRAERGCWRDRQRHVEGRGPEKRRLLPRGGFALLTAYRLH